MTAKAVQHSVIDAIYRAVDEAPTALSRVALYIAQNPDKVVHQSIGELGRNANSGQATIMRLCKLLGFEGFRDFKLALAREIEREKAMRLTQAPGIGEKHLDPDLETLGQAFQAALSDTVNLIDPARVASLAKRLAAARRTEVFGIGVSAVCADLLANRLIWLGITAHVPRSGLVAKGLASTLDKGGLAIGISYSGVTEETVAFIDQARASGARTVAITTRGDSTLATAAHDCILLSKIGPWPADGSARLVPSMALLSEYLADRLRPV